MDDRPTDVLRIQQHMIPALRTTFSAAVGQVEDALANLGRLGYLSDSWLGDEISTNVAAYYTRRAMDDSDSSHRALQLYRNELARVHDTLQQMEAAYLHNEATTAHTFGPGT